MIVYELITNAARHAFSDGKREIRVELLRAGFYVTCKVQDNGSPPRSVVPGRGLQIVYELVKTLNGTLKHKFGSKWINIVLDLSVQRWSAITTIARRMQTNLGRCFGFRSPAGKQALLNSSWGITRL
jgi:histidine kinase/DNA gyrase B/HSP90-like ATPase